MSPGRAMNEMVVVVVLGKGRAGGAAVSIYISPLSLFFSFSLCQGGKEGG